MSKSTKNSVVGFLSLVGIIATAVCLILSFCKIGGGLISLIGSLCLLLSAVVASWNYVKKCSKTIQIIYYVSIILVVVFLILPVVL